ncbi:hypothetical protein AB0M44_08325 [Streptosporangium subroseum]|uniref:hypothetical protein n=1 Tax=Streptosporangium subroseum TaxID=106412 RepID=UPI0034269262
MAIPLDHESPDPTKNDAGGGGGPVMKPTEINRFAGELEELFRVLTTAGTTSPLQAGTGSHPPSQVPEVTGSLPDLQRNCAISEKHLGEWPAAMTFSMATTTSYSVLVGESHSGGGAYSELIKQCKEIVKAFRDTAKLYEDVEQKNKEDSRRYYQA